MERLDILQAEATGDLVNASSARGAGRQRCGNSTAGLSRRVLALREQLIALEALIAYDIDFPEEDDGPISPARITRAIDDLIAALSALLATARVGSTRARRRRRRSGRCAERRKIVVVQRAPRRESRDRHRHPGNDARCDRSRDRHADGPAPAGRHRGAA
jgi:hypothetical protein